MTVNVVDDAASGLEYAAWCVGETLMATGGEHLMQFIFGLFEDEFPGETRPASWLDHRWNGVTDNRGRSGAPNRFARHVDSCGHAEPPRPPEAASWLTGRTKSRPLGRLPIQPRAPRSTR
jgi:hypothetical protein